MSEAGTAPAVTATDRRRARRNVGILAAMSAILGAQMPVYIILGGLAGLTLASNPAHATLPIAAQMVSAMIAALPLSLLMGRFGRVPGFVGGAVFGAIGGALCALALIEGSFALLCAGHACAGVYQAAQNYFRFAAADTAEESFRPRAISLVLAGGLFAALIGSEIVIRAQDLLAPVPFAGAYLVLIPVNLIGAIALPLLDLPKPPRRQAGEKNGRPWREILGDPAVPAAMLCAMLVYGTMTLVMTSTPLAMVGCGFVSAQAAGVVKWHVLAMFAPSFFTGSVIARIGARPVIAAGLLMLATCAGLALGGLELERFYGVLILLGLGWNFGFIGATSLLTAHHRADERAKVQGVNDFLVMTVVAAAALGSGAILDVGGWFFVTGGVFVPVGLAGLALLWSLRKPDRGNAPG